MNITKQMKINYAKILVIDTKMHQSKNMKIGDVMDVFKVCVLIH